MGQSNMRKGKKKKQLGRVGETEKLPGFILFFWGFRFIKERKHTRGKKCQAESQTPPWSACRRQKRL